jgi:tyrosyl-tRNA synthetase
MPTPGVFAELTWRGLVHQSTDPELGELLDREALVAYVGFDPTGDSLHLGHLLGIVTLMRLQAAGHRPIALAGGGTGMVGDPSGRSDERQLLTPATLRANVEAIRGQLSRFLDFGPEGALLVDNADWLGPMGLLEFLRDVGKHFTVNAMLAKESVRARLSEREQGISYTEFSYMLLQAYDFLRLHRDHGCRLQLGGSDQWGNITAGIDLIRRITGASAYGLTFPLITRADGTKFGKTEAGTSIWLDPVRTSPYELYQFLIRCEDAMVGTYLRQLTFRSRAEIDELDAATATDPGGRRAQRALAHDVVTLVHGEAEARAAEQASQVLFTEGIRDLPESTLVSVLADAPSTSLPRASVEGAGVVDLLVTTGLSSSRNEARRTIEGGGAYVNNRKVDGVDATLAPEDLLFGRYLILRRGKTTQHLVQVT